MHPLPPLTQVKTELDQLMAAFFAAVSFEPGGAPPYDEIRGLFIEQGLLIKNVEPVTEITTLEQFIAPRHDLVRNGTLTRFKEEELSETSDVFGNVAQRFSSYAKSGVLNGHAFETRGMISTQFVRTAEGWRISAMAWDDERAGLSIDQR